MHKYDPVGYGHVPKTMLENIEFRGDLLKWVGINESRQRQIRTIAARDILFHINTFCYGEDARLSTMGFQFIPFLTWPKQDEVVLSSYEEWGKRDQEATKSRDQGGSYLFLIMGHHSCVYNVNVHGIVVSWRLDFVDDAKNPKSLLPKVSKLHGMMPQWLVGPMIPTHMKRLFPQTGSSITGETASKNVARAARPTWVLMDEHAFWDPIIKQFEAWHACQASTRCRVSVTTVNGYATKHADIRRDPSVLHHKLMWWDNPKYARGMYRAYSDGRVEILDKANPPPADYEFVHDGILRSPMFDYEWRRADKNMVFMNREFNADEGASQEQYFPVPMLKAHAELHVKDPTYRGYFKYDPDSLEPVLPLQFIEDPRGNTSLWGEWERDKGGNIIPQRNIRFGHAADIGAGTGKSNSVQSAGNMETGEKLFEFVRCDLDELRFGRWGVAIARWLNNAYCIWDAGGPCGRSYGRAFEDAGYFNVAYHSNETSKNESAGRKPGLWLNYSLKMLVLGIYRDALDRASKADCKPGTAFYNPSNDAVLHRDECQAYVWGTDGKVRHSGASVADASGAEESHGDRVIADALLNYIMDKNRIEAIEEPKNEDPPPQSFAALVLGESHSAGTTDEERAFAQFDNWGGAPIEADPFAYYDQFGQELVAGGVR